MHEVIAFGRDDDEDLRHAPENAGPEWAVFSGWEECVTFQQNGWLREHPPTHGESAQVELTYPFYGRVGEPFWCHGKTALAVLNGYDCKHPEGFSLDVIIQARITSFGRPLPARLGRHDVELATVEIMDVKTPADLICLPPRSGNLLWQGDGFWSSLHGHAQYGDLHHVHCNLDGKFGGWAMWREQHGVGHLYLAGRWGGVEDSLFAGHRLLGTAELKLLRGDTLSLSKLP